MSLVIGEDWSRFRGGLISIVLSVINSGPYNYYGTDRIPVCTGSGMCMLQCIYYDKYI